MEQRTPHLFAAQERNHRTQADPKEGQPWKCRSCGLVLGVAFPEALLVGAIYLRQAALVECSKCGHQRPWRV